MKSNPLSSNNNDDDGDKTKILVIFFVDVSHRDMQKKTFSSLR